MLHGLSRLLPDIRRGGLDEASVYRRPAHYRARKGLVPAKGMLECPVCGRRARRFLPFGVSGRRNAQCPDCGSLERHRFLWLFLAERTRFFRRTLRVLHTAPEPCFESAFRTRHRRGYVTVDRYSPFVDVQADLTALPFPAGRFDVVLSSHVLEHVADDRAAMAELARVLKPSGWAVLMFPFDPRRPTQEDPANDTPAKRLAAYGHPYHYRIYGSDAPDRLGAAGLPATVVASRRFLSGHRLRRFRVNTNHLLLARRAQGRSGTEA